MTSNNVFVFQSAIVLVLLNTVTKAQLPKEEDCVDIPAIEKCDWHKVWDCMENWWKCITKLSANTLYVVYNMCKFNF